MNATTHAHFDNATQAGVQAVVFGLRAESFALPVTMVREILDHTPAFRMPGAPEWVLGIIDVRGTSMPVIDLGLRLGLGLTEVTLATRVLVIDLPQGGTGAPVPVALLVDRVVDVCDFAPAVIERLPEVGSRWQADYARAVMRRDSGFVVLLDAGAIFGDGSDLPILAHNDSAATH
ncbi:chemotaxis protein CheW [Novosphingobium sp. FSY-8]|uniref:Chemotaxis protein CheW n=1 Tax=Novosphingobium ovatum TaxID=1908523 RepID=A0ABW9XA57_9SPHN|nr:chemotaxis protein CheW [Novosphingobium ovatum]NBC35409.1 chemotaxis protein CheW [Novosphingobium ovatum]